MGSGPDHAHLPPVVLDDQEFVPGAGLLKAAQRDRSPQGSSDAPKPW